NAKQTPDVVSLVTYVAGQSRAMRIAVPQSHPEERKVFKLGEAAFFHRAGPWDFSCASCHGEDGKRIRTQNLPNFTKKGTADRGFLGWPGYRMTGGLMHTLQWRMNDCFRQQRFPEPGYVSDTVTSLLTYMSFNANGSMYLGPGIKRGARCDEETDNEETSDHLDRRCRGGPFRRLRDHRKPGVLRQRSDGHDPARLPRARHRDDGPAQAGRVAARVHPAPRPAAGRPGEATRRGAAVRDQAAGRRQADGRLEAGPEDRRQRPGDDLERQGRGSQRRQLLQLPPAVASTDLVRHARPEPAQPRQDARVHRRDAEVRLPADLQLEGLHAVLDDAALRHLGDADRAADQGPGRLPDGSRVAGQ